MRSLKHFHFEKCKSTQDKIFSIRERGEVFPFYVSADFQTEGRGRLTRSWEMEAGRSLALSIGMQLPVYRMMGLSLVVGLACCQNISKISLELKWPNDLMMGLHKVGGILIESHSQGDLADVAIGIGINLFDLTETDYRGLGFKISAESLVEEILRRVEEFEKSGFSKFRSAYEERMWKRGERLWLQVGNEKKYVDVLGVNDEGCLMTREGEVFSVTEQGEIILE